MGGDAKQAVVTATEGLIVQQIGGDVAMQRDKDDRAQQHGAEDLSPATAADDGSDSHHVTKSIQPSSFGIYRSCVALRQADATPVQSNCLSEVTRQND